MKVLNLFFFIDFKHILDAEQSFNLFYILISMYSAYFQ